MSPGFTGDGALSKRLSLSARGSGAVVEGVVEKLHWIKKEMLKIRKQQAAEHDETFDPDIQEWTIYRIKISGAIIKE